LTNFEIYAIIRDGKIEIEGGLKAMRRVIREIEKGTGLRFEGAGKLFEHYSDKLKKAERIYLEFRDGGINVLVILITDKPAPQGWLDEFVEENGNVQIAPASVDGGKKGIMIQGVELTTAQTIELLNNRWEIANRYL